MATFDQLSDVAGSVSNRLRRTASMVPEGTVGKVKKTKARFSGPDNPFKADQTLRGAEDARPELTFNESQARAQQAEAITNRAAAAGRPLAPDEQAFIDKAPSGYPEFIIGDRVPGAKATMMSGEAAQAMSDSKPYGRRMLRADQPDVGLGEPAQRSLAIEMADTVPTGSVNKTLQDVYSAYAPKETGKVYDLPNEYLNLPPGELRNRLATSSGENIVDTRGIPYRQESKQGYGYDGGIFQDLDAIPLEDRATQTGNPMDTYLQGFSRDRPKLGADPELMAQAQDMFDAGSDRVALPFGSRLDYTEGYPEVQSARQGNELTIGTLGSGELSRRLRQQNPQAYSVIQDRLAPVANPTQVDFRQATNQGRLMADAEARARSAQLDQAIMSQNAAVTGADTTNFVIKDVNPDEYYLYGSQKDTQGLLPDEVAGGSRTYGYQPSDSLVKMGFNSKPLEPINLGAGKVGLGVDITNKDPYSRAAVTRLQPSIDTQGIARDPRYIPVDPITPIDLELPGVRYAEKSGLQADITPELAIAEDQRAAARLRAIANLEQGAVAKYQAAPREMMNPDIQRRADNAYNAIVQSDILDSSAANMQNAMRIANEQTVPQGDVILTQISNQGPGQTVPIRGQQMPFEQALEVMKPYERGGAAEQVLRLPVVPTQAPEQTQLGKRLRLAQQVGTPESASIMSDEAMGLYKAVAAADPSVVPNEIRRGVQYTMVPEGDTGQGYKIRLDNPGEPVLDPATNQRMRWQGQPIETYNPRELAQNQALNMQRAANYETPSNVADPLAQQQAPVEFATRARATRPQMKEEANVQMAQAIEEGYTPRGTGTGPLDQVILTGNDLSDMRGGLSQVEALQARKHNLARQLSGLPLAYPDTLAMEQIISGVPTSDRTVDLIRNPPAQGGVFTWGADDYGYGSEAAARFPSSGPPVTIQSGGMLNAFMTEPQPARFMRPSIRQVPAQQPLVYQRPPQVPSQIQPPRIEGRPDLDWQRSPSFRFPQNVWQGSGRVV